MLMEEILKEMRNQIGDTDLEEPNITDDELTVLLKNAAKEYSRMKNYLKRIEIEYKPDEDMYDIPTDCYKIKSVILKSQKKEIKFIDNLTQIIIENHFNVKQDTLVITYSRYFSPEEIDEREMDLFFLLCEAYCYRLMASKTADLIKFATGEKMVDETQISKNYLKLYDKLTSEFKSKIIKAYGRRADNPNVNLDYDLPYPVLGEMP